MEVDVTVFQVLENELWNEMNMAIGDSTVRSRQSSDSSTVFGEDLPFFTISKMDKYKQVIRWRVLEWLESSIG